MSPGPLGRVIAPAVVLKVRPSKGTVVRKRTRLVARAIAGAAAVVASGIMIAGPAVAATSSGTPGSRVIETDGAGTVSAPVYGNLHAVTVDGQVSQPPDERKNPEQDQAR